MLVAFWEKLALPLLAKVSRYDMWRWLEEGDRLYALARAEREAERLRSLSDMLEHAYAHVPHYRRKFDQVGLKPADIRSFEDLRQLPITTKAEIQAAFPDDMIARPFRDDPRLRRSQSGATSGPPLHVRMDFAAVVRKYAEITRHERHNGWHVGDRTVHSLPCPYVDYYVRGLIKEGTFLEGLGQLSKLRSRELDRDIVWYLENYVVFPLLHRRLLLRPVISLEGEVDDRLTASHLQRLRRFAPVMVRSHPLYTYLWARHLERSGEAPPQIGAIELTGGLASDGMKRITERALGAQVYDYYGSAEIGGIAAECHHQRGMHIYENVLHIEFLRGGRPAEPGETSSVVITDLANRAMPFIRYWTDDVGSYHARDACPCGLDTTRMELAGRTFEMLVDRDGVERTGQEVIDRVLEAGDLELFQLVLLEPGRASLRVLRDRHPAGGVERAADGLRDLFGPAWTLDVQRVDRLPPEKRGKYCFVKARFKQDLPGLFSDGRPD